MEFHRAICIPLSSIRHSRGVGSGGGFVRWSSLSTLARPFWTKRLHELQLLESSLTGIRKTEA
ncbi:hypothetical protein Hanom_Chr16g01430291 [Helianthus anomalus]